MNTNMPDVPPSVFVKMGQPNCSRWGKSEMEWLALAYVEALAADGDTWKQISKERTYELLTDEQRCFVHCMLTDDFYDGWFQAIRDRITDSAGAWSVGGFWNKWRYDQVTAPTSASNPGSPRTGSADPMEKSGTDSVSATFKPGAEQP